MEKHEKHLSTPKEIHEVTGHSVQNVKRTYRDNSDKEGIYNAMDIGTFCIKQSLSKRDVFYMVKIFHEIKGL